MNVVLYTADFEPITVIDVPVWAMDRMRAGDRVQIPIFPPIDYSAKSIEPIAVVFKAVEIWSVILTWKGVRKDILMTNNEDGALALDASWLPGQQKEINRYKRDIRGLAAFLCAALGGQR